MDENDRIKILPDDDSLVVKYEDMKKDCPKCGAIYYKHTYCPSCGAYFCNDCGHIIREGKK